VYRPRVRGGVALAIAAVGCGAIASVLLAWAHGLWMRGAWAGMDYAFAVEATGNLEDAQQVQREAWRTMTDAAGNSALLLRVSLALYLACIVCASIVVYRQRAAWRRWLWLALFALLPALFGVYVATLDFFARSPTPLGLASATLASAASGAALWRGSGEAAPRAMAFSTLTLGSLSIIVLIGVRVLFGGF
jgi:hypothetical protein